MSKKVVIAGSASLKKEMQKWVDFWEAKPDHEVIDYPNPIDKSKILTEYPKVHQEFFRNLTRADLVFIANEDKGGGRRLYRSRNLCGVNIYGGSELGL